MKQRLLFSLIFILLWSNQSSAQSVDYQASMEDVMDSYLSDYPEPTIKKFDVLFAGVDIDALPPKTCFFYHLYYGAVLSTNYPDEALTHLLKAREISLAHSEVGIRNVFALQATYLLADLFLNKAEDKVLTDPYCAFAILLYTDIVTVGISMTDDKNVFAYVIQSFIEQARLGKQVWLYEDWVKKIWIQARDLAIELNDETIFTYYLLNVLNYYCDLGDYETALSFMEDAKNKDILLVNASSYCQRIREVEQLISQSESIKSSNGIQSIDYWANKLHIAAISTTICSKERSFQLLCEVEQGLIEHRFTESYEYAVVLYLLANNKFKYPEMAEQYFARQLEILETHPQYLVYTSDAELFNSLAVCQMKLGKYHEAQGNYQKALDSLNKADSDSNQTARQKLLAIIYHNVGRNLFYLQQYKESVEYYNQSLELQEEVNGSVMPRTKVYLSESQNSLSNK